MTKKAILLVDDVELFLELEKSFLARESFTLHTARSGTEALEKARTLRPDIILLDLYMPDLDGDAVCRTLKSSTATSAIPVLMVSSDTVPGTRERCFAAGCDSFVSKPLQREALLGAIEEMLKVAQRAFPRIPVRIDCLLRTGEGEQRSWIHCLSEGGAFIETDPPLKSGTRVTLVFGLTRGGKMLTVESVARWTGFLAAPHKVKGTGVEFTLFDAGSRGAIHAYIETKRHILQSLHRIP